jgi:hypothetical protein
VEEQADSDLRELPSHLEDPQIKLLMADYEHLTKSFHMNEEMGERRVNVFFGLIGAFTAALGLASDWFATDADLAGAAAVASFALLAFGVVTLRRLMERNLVTTSYLNGLRRIRAFFVWQEPELANVLPFVPRTTPHVRRRGTKRNRDGKKGEERWWGLGKAGYLESAAAANCFLAAAGVGAPLSQQTAVWWWLTLAAVAAAATWLAQMSWARATYKSGTDKESIERREALEWWATATREPR